MSTDTLPPPQPCADVLAALWQAAGLPAAALAQIDLGETTAPVLPSSFCVASAAQASLAAAALAAAELWHLHHPQQPRQRVAVDRSHATLDCQGFFALDGRTPNPWDKLSGLYPCGADRSDGGPDGPAGWVRLHTNFAHHRDGVLRLLGLAPGPGTGRDAVTQALRRWRAEDFEQAAADAGLVVAAARSFADWDAHPQGQALAGQPLLAIDRLGDAPPLAWAGAAPADQPPGAAPLHGLRVLDLTRILAGPVAGRCLAAYGADVMLVNAPHLPNIEAIADTSRGKLSTLIDLREPAGRARLDALIDASQVLLQGYRPGALAGRGYSPEALARRRPGIVVAELSAYGWAGPWAGRRGFDSLVQTATGFNQAEGQAAGLGAGPGAQPATNPAAHPATNPSSSPSSNPAAGTPLSAAPLRALPLQILDYATGHLLAFGIQAALWRQATQGGSWRVRVSLAGVGLWLRSLGRQAGGLAVQAPARLPWLEDSACGFGTGPGGSAVLRALRHPAQFSATPAQWRRPSMPPGSHAPAWPTWPDRPDEPDRPDRPDKPDRPAKPGGPGGPA